MSLVYNCWFQSSQCHGKSLLNILTSFFVQPLFLATNLNLLRHTLFLQREFFFSRFVSIYSAVSAAIEKEIFWWIGQFFHEICKYKNWVDKRMAGQEQEKKARYSKETPWFLEYYIAQCSERVSKPKIFWDWFFDFNVAFSMYIMTMSSQKLLICHENIVKMVLNPVHLEHFS